MKKVRARVRNVLESNEDIAMALENNRLVDPWPAFSYAEFAATQHLLHMGLVRHQFSSSSRPSSR